MKEIPVMAKSLELQIKSSCQPPYRVAPDLMEVGASRTLGTNQDSGCMTAEEAYTQSGYPENFATTFIWEGPKTRRCFKGGRELWCKDVERTT
jgi:hypothetical protein